MEEEAYTMLGGKKRLQLFQLKTTLAGLAVEGGILNIDDRSVGLESLAEYYQRDRPFQGRRMRKRLGLSRDQS